MNMQPVSGKPRVLPFRAAAADLGRPHVTEKIAGRPTVPMLPSLGGSPMEEQDASLSGMTRSLHRRVLGLNFPVASARTQRQVA